MTETTQDFVTAIACLVAGPVFLAAGVAKGGLSKQERRRDLAILVILPGWIREQVIVWLPFVEVLLGFGLLMLPEYRTPFGRITTLLLAAFTIVIVNAWIRTGSVSCGCFGARSADAKASPVVLVARNLILMASAAWIGWWAGDARFSWTLLWPAACCAVTVTLAYQVVALTSTIGARITTPV